MSEGTLNVDPTLGVEKAEVEKHEHHELEELTQEELVTAQSLVRKIDLKILPLVVFVYLMNYIDRYAHITSLPKRPFLLLTPSASHLPVAGTITLPPDSKA